MVIMKRKLSLAALFSSTALALAMAGPASAEGSGGMSDSSQMGAESGMTDDSQMQAGSAPAFSELDANEDGVISREEALGSQELVSQWESADTDGTDDISESEFSAFEEQMKQGGATSDMPGATEGDTGTMMDEESGMMDGGTEEQPTDSMME